MVGLLLFIFTSLHVLCARRSHCIRRRCYTTSCRCPKFCIFIITFPSCNLSIFIRTDTVVALVFYDCHHPKTDDGMNFHRLIVYFWAVINYVAMYKPKWERSNRRRKKWNDGNLPSNDKICFTCHRIEIAKKQKNQKINDANTFSFSGLSPGKNRELIRRIDFYLKIRTNSTLLKSNSWTET